MSISANLKDNEIYLKKVFEDCADFIFRPLTMSDGREGFIVAIDGLVNGQSLHEDMLYPLFHKKIPIIDGKLADAEEILMSGVTFSEVSVTDSINKIVADILTGDVGLLIDGATQAVLAQVKGWPMRGVSQPDLQRTNRGPKEAFTETMLFNTAMVRRKLKTPTLKTEYFKVGGTSTTDVCMAYVKDSATQELVDEVRKKIKDINVDYVLESGHIEQLIEENPKSIFPTVSNNEKPDVVAGKLMKGRVAIFTDGTPFVLTVPMLFTENFHSVEDYYSRKYYATLVRTLRLIAYFVSVFLPAIYVALVAHHQEFIPEKLLSTLISANSGTAFSVSFELIFLLVIYEMIREALIRPPASIVGTVGLVGALVIGDMAVGSKLVSSPAIVISALTFLGTAIVNSCADSTAILRIGLVLLATFFGMFGVLAGIFIIIIHLSSLKSFGTPYLLPLAPVVSKGLSDTFVRGGIKGILRKGGF